MDEDLFTYEVEIPKLANISCDLNEENYLEQRITHRSDDVLEFDPSNVEFTEWSISKFYNHMTMDWYTKNVLWIYWARVGNSLHYQDFEWYEALEDGELKDEALRNKAILEGIINEDDESGNEGWRSWDDYKVTNDDREERDNESEQDDEVRHELCNDATQEFLEDEYNDLTSTSEEACRAYQEIFRMMNAGWMVTTDE
nr:zf-BED domain-containing protein [Tanacetum cinerariifolium]